MNKLDKYDHMILDIIHMHRSRINVTFAWLCWAQLLEASRRHRPPRGKARIGDITNLYLDGVIQNKVGMPHQEGREQLAFAP